MTGRLPLPLDGPWTADARLGTWLTERVAMPAPISPPGECVLLAATAGVVARMTGETTVAVAVNLPAGPTAAVVPVGLSDTVAHLVAAAEHALSEPPGTGPRPLQILISTGPAEPGDDTEIVIVAQVPPAGQPGSVAVSGPAALFDASTLLRIAGMMARVLGLISQSGAGAVPVADLPLLADDEQLALVERFNDTETAVPRHGAIERIAENCRAFPDHEALITAGHRVSYAELFRLVEIFRSDLRALGVGRQDPVYLCLPRGPELVLAWLAVLATGAVCLPLDPDCPPARLRELTSPDPLAPILAVDRSGSVRPDPERVHLIDFAGLRVRAARPSGAVPTAAAVISEPADIAYVIHTSGSTGVPKGVLIEHASLTNLLHASARPFGLGRGRRCLAAANPGFDVSVWEILAPLYAGATIVGFDEPHLTAEALARVVTDQHVDTVFLLASLLAQLDPASFPGVRTVITGGESFSDSLVDRWQPGRDLIYVYGPTEATVFQSWHRCLAGSPTRAPTIGRPMPNLRFHLLDRWGGQVPPGVVGELYIGGQGPGRGYRNLPDATQRAFVADRFQPGGGRLYRTGDLASFRADGALDFRGRVDHQVKIRGFRIEPGEVETLLCTLPGVTGAAVVVATAGSAAREPALVGYVTAEPGTDLAGLRAAITERLPYYLVPAAITAIGEFPRTPNGKIDRASLAALPLPDGVGAGGELDPAAVPELTDEVSRKIAARLGLAQVATSADFFALGGDSLGAAGLAAELAAAHCVPVRTRDVFTHPTAAMLAARIDALTRVVIDGDLSELSGDDRSEPAASTSDYLPLLPAQRWLWLHAQTLPDGLSAYHVPLLLTFDGQLDHAALSAAFDELQRRHPLLSARVRADRGTPHLFAGQPPAKLEVLPAEAGQSDLRSSTAFLQRVNAPFDLQHSPPIRASLFQAADRGQSVLLLVAHHLVCDGPSLEVIASDLVALHDAFFAGDAIPAEPSAALATVIGDIDRRIAGYASSQQDLEYWRSRLTPPPQPLALPLDHRRTAAPGSRTDFTTAELPAELLESARHAGRAYTSTFALMIAVVAIVLRRATGAQECCIGTAVDLRSRLGLDGQVGCHVNSVAVRLPLAGQQSFRDLLNATVAEIVDAVDHAGYPFDQIVGRLAPVRQEHRNPYFDVWVTVYRETACGGSGGLMCRGGPVPPDTGLFDLSFQFCEHPGGVRLDLQYDCTLYERATVESICERLHVALHQAADRPDDAIDDLDLRTADERAVRERTLFTGFTFAPR
jgi:amino acid adenylation domain-containing protein